MHKSVIFLLTGVFLCINGRSQIMTFYKDGLDTLKKHQFTGNLYLGFYFSQDALQYLYLSSTVAGLYVDIHNTYEISGVVTLKGMEKRSTSNNGYVISRANFCRLSHCLSLYHR